MTTLHTVQAAIINYADQTDRSAQAIAEVKAKAVSTLKAYIPEGVSDARQSAEFKAAGDSVKVALRSVYVSQPRFTGRDRSGEVNMTLAKSLLDMSDADREALPKDSEAKKIWSAMLTYCRGIWADIADEAFPKPKAEKSETDKAKKAPTPDAILANLDAFLASNPAPALVANLFDQIMTRRPKK